MELHPTKTGWAGHSWQREQCYQTLMCTVFGKSTWCLGINKWSCLLESRIISVMDLFLLPKIQFDILMHTCSDRTISEIKNISITSKFSRMPIYGRSLPTSDPRHKHRLPSYHSRLVLPILKYYINAIIQLVLITSGFFHSE